MVVLTFQPGLGNLRAPAVKNCSRSQDVALRHLDGSFTFAASATSDAQFHHGPGRSGACTFRGALLSTSKHSTFKESAVAANVPLQARLQAFGLAGVVSYGLLNTVYYIAAFLFFWTRVAKVPKGLGFKATAAQFVGVMGLTWAGSQLTKVARLAGALAMAPFMDIASVSAQKHLQLKSKRSALMLVIAGCLATASIAFGATILVWA